MMLAKEMASDVLYAVKGFVERSLKPLADRISDLEKRAPIPGPRGEKGIDGAPGARGEKGEDGLRGERGIDGIPGRDGKDGAPGERGPVGEKGIQGERGPEGAKGLDGPAGRDGRDGKDGAPGRDGDRGPKGDKGEKGEPGRDGIDGQNGKDFDPELIRLRAAEILPELVQKAEAMLSERLESWIRSVKLPEDGKEGPPGRDGRDGKPGVQGEKGIDGRDGVNGRDGADGLGFDDFEIDYDGERGFTFKCVSGDRVKTKTFQLPVPIYRGTYKTADVYEKDDTVTYAGSLWIAQQDNPGTPGDGPTWKLAVRKGVDGKAK